LLAWLRSHHQLKRENRLVEQRVRLFLENYLAADGRRKSDFYEVVGGAAAACHPNIADSALENIELAQKTAALALRVFKHRLEKRIDEDEVQSMITDAYAAVAVSNYRAAALYALVSKMQRLGTAAVHLVTMSISHMALNGPDE
jgi:hypothetical protein